MINNSLTQQLNIRTRNAVLRILEKGADTANSVIGFERNDVNTSDVFTITKDACGIDARLDVVVDARWRTWQIGKIAPSAVDA